MYGWRGRIGLLVPSINTTMETEFWRIAPEGVSVHSARISGGRHGTPEELRSMSDLAGAVTLSAHGASEEKLATVGRVENLNGAWRIYPRDKSKAPELAQSVVELVAREGWKVEGMYSERGELDEVFRRITLPDTVKK